MQLLRKCSKNLTDFREDLMGKIVIANWKSHKNSDNCRKWLDKFVSVYRQHRETEIIIAPSMVSLESVSNHITQLGIINLGVAAQDVSPYPLGSYTGAVAADLIKPYAKYVIIGHSERRRYFHETIQDVTNKLIESGDSGLIPIVCVESIDVFSRMLSLVDLDSDKLIVAYTPVDALNFAIPESVENISAAARKIAGLLPGHPIVYGGAVHPDNAGQYSEIENLSGLFVGAASLEVESFTSICTQFGPVSS